MLFLDYERRRVFLPVGEIVYGSVVIFVVYGIKGTESRTAESIEQGVESSNKLYQDIVDATRASR